MLEEKARNPHRLDWHDLVGGYVLVGLTTQDSGGRIVERRQLHGRVVAADSNLGVSIALEGCHAGETYSLPPDLRSFEPAPPGEYRLAGTGEVVTDPDFVTTWIVELPDS